MADSQNDCLLDSLTKYDGTAIPPPTRLIRARSSTTRGWTPCWRVVSPLHYPGVPRTPILFYHSLNDEFAPIAEIRKLAARYCAEGRIVHIVTLPAGDHIAYVLTGFPTALKYIAQRFAGEPPPNDCRTR